VLPERLRAYLPKKKSKEELDEHYENVELEKGDFMAMIIAAVITILPVVIIVLLLIYGFTWLLFIR